jgi:mannose/cellobiose epimerase-like protein (N-acyl-D-glucosamine 2-epimerase family)
MEAFSQRMTLSKKEKASLDPRAELQKLMSFYFPQCLDPSGGFFDCFSQGGDILVNSRRHLVSCARMTINHARVAALTHQPALLQGVHHGLRHLRQAHRDSDGGYAWLLDGSRPLDRSRHCYGLAFVMLAYARALSAGVAQAGSWLEEVWELLQSRFWEPGAEFYSDQADVNWKVTGYRGQNANMHVCEALIAAYEATGEIVWLARASRLAERVVNGLAANDRGWIWEHFDAGWRPDWEYNRLDDSNRYRSWGYQPGHQLEWAKLLLILERHDRSNWRPARARQLFDEAVRAGWDVEFGGVVYALDTDLLWHDTNKYGWVQAEALSAAALLARATGLGDYRVWFEKVTDYISRQLIDRKTRTWHRMLQRHGSPILDRRSLEGKSDYHSVGTLCDLIQLDAVP